MTTEELLRSAITKLGPFGAHNALTAFAERDAGQEEVTGDWNRCGLACSFGARGELQAAMRELPSATSFHRAAAVLGLTVEEVEAFTAAFDDSTYVPVCVGTYRSVPGERYEALRSLLEAEAAKIHTSPSVATATPAGAVA